VTHLTAVDTNNISIKYGPNPNLTFSSEFLFFPFYGFRIEKGFTGNASEIPKAPSPS
jgi:hypothetical protein